MTLREALDYGRGRLTEAKIEEANLDAWLLLEYITRVSRASYFGNQDATMEETQWTAYRSVIEERGKRIPLQHITGVQEFMGFVFQVNENVLIPRQDTEVLVETALDNIPRDLTCSPTNEKLKILDMCTGTGCILISLLRMRDGVIEGTGADISVKALEVARNNAVLNEVEAVFVESNLYENVAGSYDMIISNPPYIPTRVIEELEEEVKLHDPMLALDGKEDGLYFYRKIIDEAESYLNPEGILLFEIGHDQGDDISRYMIEKGFKEVRVKKDLAGLDRVVYGHVQ